MRRDISFMERNIKNLMISHMKRSDFYGITLTLYMLKASCRSPLY